MLFVPLPLFATLILTLMLVRFLWARDMRLRAHQLFALLIALYGAQSLLSSLRWGYGIESVAIVTIILAPILPAIAFLAYGSLSERQTGWRLWPMGVVILNWVIFVLIPPASDPVILMTYIGFGAALLRLAWKGVDHLPLSPISDAREIVVAMYLTGVALIASGMTDVYVIYDFVRNSGQNAGLILTFVQTAFVVIIGVSGVFGKITSHTTQETDQPPSASKPSTDDTDVMDRLERLFDEEQLYLSEDLSLRRISRRLGLPDRQVSNAINRQKQISVSQYVNGLRVRDACKMLLETDQTILHISLAAGFATKSNFNREFLRVTGQSPSQWRSSNKGGNAKDAKIN